MKRLFVVACIASLAACGADSDKREVESRYQQEWEQLKASLIYTYPAKQQVEVPTHSPVVLHFSSNITESLSSIEADLVVTADGNPVPFTVDFANNRTLMIEVEGGLDARTAYQVSIPEIDLAIGTTKESALGFETKGLVEGPRSAVAGENFEIVRMIPDGNNYPVVDFATFRVQFSDVLDAGSVVYGDSVSLKGDGGALVDAHVLVKGHYLTVDPKSDLTPGASYTLSITDGVRSKSGVQIPAKDYVVVARGTGPRERLVHEVPANGMQSPLTGRTINMIPMASVLLGEETETQSSGDLLVELAYTVNFPDAMPIRVPRGTLLEAAELAPVLIGGAVDAGFNSGDVRITFISDATGYMIPNPHSTADDAARNIHLFMDVGVSTADPKANGAINQDILHIELVGTAIVENGGLTVNAVGMVEPEVLGSERAKALLSFYMEGKPGEAEPAADTVPPQLVSWTPGENPDDSFGVNDSILFVFNEPVSIDGASIELRENGEPIAAQVSVDGTTLVIKPAQPLKHSRESTDITKQGEVTSYEYTVALGAGITDLAGNAAAGVSGDYEFELPILPELALDVSMDPGTGMPINEVRPAVQRAPIVLATYPGYPCVYDDASQSIADGILGRCRSGLVEPYESGEPWFSPHLRIIGNYEHVSREADDVIHVPELPSNRPIVAIFTKNIDPDSVSNATFIVERVDSTGALIEQVEGSPVVEGNTLTFWPAAPWIVGEKYRYVLVSTGDVTGAAAVECGVNAICDLDGLPLQTQLRGTGRTEYTNAVAIDEIPVPPAAGGPAMVQFFTAVDATENVLQVLRAPSLDRNGNLVADRDFPGMAGDADFFVDFVSRHYLIEEVSESGFDPIPGQCTVPGPACLDPHGVRPLPNTSKLLSVRTGRYEWVTENASGGQANNAWIGGINTGCGYEADNTTPFVCPENKVVYLNSGLIAEVGVYDPAEDAVGVTIWPGQITVTSLPTPVWTQLFMMGLDSGPQRIRMRYAHDPACDPTVSDCQRDRPIQGWIRNNGTGPTLEAKVDAYVDALDLEASVGLLGMLFDIKDYMHEIVSVPITLELQGDVEFLSDGRMVVHQFNANEARVHGHILGIDPLAPDLLMSVGPIEFAIPEGGVYMQYVSSPVK